MKPDYWQAIAQYIDHRLRSGIALGSADLMTMYHLVSAMDLPIAAGLMTRILRRMKRMNRCG
jgi:hypothetical protein